VSGCAANGLRQCSDVYESRVEELNEARISRDNKDVYCEPFSMLMPRIWPNALAASHRIVSCSSGLARSPKLWASRATGVAGQQVATAAGAFLALGFASNDAD
jgi:hypothetical protein